MMKTVAAAIAMTVLGFGSAGNATADELNKLTILTFNKPVEVPGHVLPAGTYRFQLADSTADRHIVYIFNADGSTLVATVMAIANSRLDSADETVIKFDEVPRGSTDAIRAWFYPGDSTGHQFVYPKARAMQLAKASKAVVPALAVDVVDEAALKTAPIVAVTPDEKEVPLTAAILTTPGNRVAAVATVPDDSSAAVDRSARTDSQLPQTASALPLIALLGFASIALAFGLMVVGKKVTASAL